MIVRVLMALMAVAGIVAAVFAVRRLRIREQARARLVQGELPQPPPIPRPAGCGRFSPPDLKSNSAAPAKR